MPSANIQQQHSPRPQGSAMQLFPDLEPEVEAALRASIARFGVIIPIVKDQNGRILDGNHRARIAAELGTVPDEIIVKVENEAEAREYARTLNADRRHLTPDQRREVVGVLRSEGHSLRAIGGAVGASKSQVERDLSIVPPGTISPERVVRQGGGTYPAQRPPRLSAPVKNQQAYEAKNHALHRDQRHEVQAVTDVAKRVVSQFRRTGSFVALHPRMARAVQLDAFLDAARALATPTVEELQRELASAERFLGIAEASETAMATGGRTVEAERARRRVERAREAIAARNVTPTGGQA